MKSLATLWTTVMAALVISFFPGCQKAIDCIKQAPPDSARLCQIQQMIANTSYGSRLYYNFSYNAAGNPTDITISSTGNIYDPETHFRYDKYGRLSSYYTDISGPNTAIYWHYYTYVDQRTIIDTTYEYVDNTNAGPPFDFHTYGYSVTVFKLDGLGRIMTEKLVWSILGGTDIVNYTYDAQGNRVLPGATYDDKINVYRTNRVWQFVYKDYSVNNRTNDSVDNATRQITSYTDRGLPSLIYSSDQATNVFLFNYDFLILQIIYNCEPPRTPAAP